MNRNDLIVAINNLFDENINLKVRNEYLESKNKDREKCSDIVREPLDETTKKVIEYGKQQLFEQVIRGGWSSSIDVYEDEDTKELIITPMKKWVDNKIYQNYIPENMSKEDILNILYDEIEEMYEKEKSEAIKKYQTKKKGK